MGTDNSTGDDSEFNDLSVDELGGLDRERTVPRVEEDDSTGDEFDDLTLDELDSWERKRTLERAEMEKGQAKAHSSCACLAELEDWGKECQNMEQFLTFHPAGSTRAGVTIHKGDLGGLQPGEMLNNSIMDFHILQIVEGMTAEQRSQCHMFSTYFWRKQYSCLHPSTPRQHKSQKTSEEEEKLQEERLVEAFNGVKRWTKTMDIFEKSFLFIPICEQLHWTIAIVCWPHPRWYARNDTPVRPEAHPLILHLNSASAVDCESLGLGQVLCSYIAKAWECQSLPPGSSGPLQLGLRAPVSNNVHTVRVPQQTNGVDCGLFVLEFIRQFVNEFVPSGAADHDNVRTRVAQWRTESSTWFSAENVPGTLRREIACNLVALRAAAQGRQSACVLPSPKVRSHCITRCLVP